MNHAMQCQSWTDTCFKSMFLCGKYRLVSQWRTHHSGSRGKLFADWSSTWKEVPSLSMLRPYRLLHRPRLNYMSTHLISPHKVFSNPLPSPPQWSRQRPVLLDVQQATSPQWKSAIFESCSKVPHSSFLPTQWKEGNDSGRNLERTLNRFARTLRSVHKRKINWLKNESFPNE